MRRQPCEPFIVRRTGSTAMPSSKLAWVLERAGATEHREPGRGYLFSESLLIVDTPQIYDQEGDLRATIKSSSDDASFVRRVFSRAPRVRKVVDVDDQILLTFEIGYRTFRSIATNGTEIAKIVIPPGSKRKKTCPIEAAGERIGTLCHGDRHGNFSVRDTEHIEIARITHVTPRFGALWYATGCNVIEINDRMPNALRPLLLAASACVFDLTSPNV